MLHITKPKRFVIYVAKSKKTPGVLEKSGYGMRKKRGLYFQHRKRAGKWVRFVFSQRCRAVNKLNIRLGLVWGFFLALQFIFSNSINYIGVF